MKINTEIIAKMDKKVQLQIGDVTLLTAEDGSCLTNNVYLIVYDAYLDNYRYVNLGTAEILDCSYETLDKMRKNNSSDVIYDSEVRLIGLKKAEV